MTKLHRSLAFVSLFGICALTASAAEVNGVLMDKMCSAKAVKQGQSFAAAHDAKCALQPPCQKSGYGVFTSDNRFLSLDAAGNAKAFAALKATKKTDNLIVTVDGDIQGDMIKVASLKIAQ